MDQLVRDLEEVLTYESARSGGATGEATAILSQLPASIAGRRSRRRTIGLAVVYVAIAAVVAVVAALLVNGESQQNEPVAPGDLQAIALNESDAHEYDPPPGDGRERGTQGAGARRRPLHGLGDRALRQPGPRQPEEGRRPVPGRRAADRRARDADRDAEGRLDASRCASRATASPRRCPAGPWSPAARWTRRARPSRSTPAGQRSRYYLLWITKLTEGATGGSSAAVSEVKLLS